MRDAGEVVKAVVEGLGVGGGHRSMAKGIIPRDDFPVRPRIEELLKEGHLLISDHSMQNLAEEHHFPGPVIERANQSRWLEEGGLSVNERARTVADQLEVSWTPPDQDEAVFHELDKRMQAAAGEHGLDRLPGAQP